MNTTINPHSVENQRICERLVNREVHYCVSSLIHHFSQNESALEGSDYSYDDILDLCTGKDWESAWDDGGELREDSEGQCYAVAKEDLQFLKSGLTDEEWDELLSEHGKPVDNGASFQECCEALDIEPYDMEVYEHWIVSEWFAARLKEKGHPTGELFGMTIWGRPTTGQAIHMDGVIGEIAADMEILKGQKYDWSASE